MDHGNPQTSASCKISNPLPEQTVLIIGAGHFGKRAAKILNLYHPQKHPLFIIDRDEGNLSKMEGSHLEKISCDGIQFLMNNLKMFHPSNILIPAVPFHLAYEYLKNNLAEDYIIKQIEVPWEIKNSLPFTWEETMGSLLVSYADFSCPDDCPEPEDHCTVTGEKRGPPLYQLVEGLDLPGFIIHIVRSYQLAPGLGGYNAGALAKLIARVRERGSGRWLVGTACSCHGTLTALEVKNPQPKDGFEQCLKGGRKKPKWRSGVMK